MLYYDKIDISEGVDLNMTIASKDCDICNYWYFLDKGFKFQPYVCNGCQDLLKMSINVKDFAVFNIRGVDYCCNIYGISKCDAINILHNADSNEKGEYYKNKKMC